MTQDSYQKTIEKIDEFYKIGNQQKSFDECLPLFFNIFEVGNEYREELNVIFILADIGDGIFSKDKSNDGKLGLKEFKNLIEKIPEDKSDKERLFAETIFNSLGKKQPYISKSQFKTLFDIMTFTQDTKKLIIEEINPEIKSSAWKEYLNYYGEKDGVFNDVFNIVAEDRKESREKVITLERFISWYINCC